MINRIVIFILLIPFLTGCIASNSITKYISDLTMGDKIIFSALDSKPDGYTNVIKSSNKVYKIVSTKINNSGLKLCRVVSIQSRGKFEVKTYCKVKGGDWK
ncbi:MAG: hypothetical protein DSZ18_00015 [Candidatus Thioglobus sp.]|nr:MAG: hypothetical protein DSZ18_00015 [Candidatus Thioglobus sp.]